MTPMKYGNPLKTVLIVDNEFDLSQLSSIGITNQRETTLAWRKQQVSLFLMH